MRRSRWWTTETVSDGEVVARRGSWRSVSVTVLPGWPRGCVPSLSHARDVCMRSRQSLYARSRHPRLPISPWIHESNHANSVDECCWGRLWSYVSVARRSAPWFHPLALISRRMYHGAPLTCTAFCLSHLEGIIQRAMDRFEYYFLFFARGRGGGEREKFVMKVGRGNVYRSMVLKIYFDGFRDAKFREIRYIFWGRGRGRGRSNNNIEGKGRKGFIICKKKILGCDFGETTLNEEYASVLEVV